MFYVVAIAADVMPQDARRCGIHARSGGTHIVYSFKRGDPGGHALEVMQVDRKIMQLSVV